MPIPDIPCIIYDAAALRRRYRLLRAFLDDVYPRSRIFYALKACYAPKVVEELLSLGAGLEVSAPAELGIAEYFGLRGKDIVWNAPGMDARTLDRLIEHKAHIHVDSQAQWVRTRRALVGRTDGPVLGLRLNLFGQGKFGMTPEQAERFLKPPRAMAISGIHLHRLPSGAFSRERVNEEKLLLLDLIALWERRFGLRVRYVDLGGGIVPDRAFWRQVGRRLRNLTSRPELFVEPGSFLVRDAGTALTRVLSQKTIGRSRWFIADISSNALVPTDPATAPPAGRGSIAGPFCFEGDVLSSGAPAGMKTGEIVAIPACGAYSTSWASAFGAFPPAVYWKDGASLVPIRRGDEGHRAFLAFHGYPAKE